MLRSASGEQARKLRDFIGDARLALGRTGDALRATAHPIEIARVKGRGRTWALSADVQAALGLLLAGGALGALGALLGAVAREARTASLVALLVVMPVVFLGLVPQEIVPAAGWISDGLPFIHAVRFFSAALYDASPWWQLLRETLWLGGLGALFGLLARIGTRRLLA